MYAAYSQMSDITHQSTHNQSGDEHNQRLLRYSIMNKVMWICNRNYSPITVSASLSMIKSFKTTKFKVFTLLSTRELQNLKKEMRKIICQSALNKWGIASTRNFEIFTFHFVAICRIEVESHLEDHRHGDFNSTTTVGCYRPAAQPAMRVGTRHRSINCNSSTI